MRGVFEWINQNENQFFTVHVGFILIAAVIAELFLSGWTKFAYPALLLIAVASFLIQYPVKHIKEHGLFSEYLIELRVLWLIIIGIFLEYIVFQVLETTDISLASGAALVVGLVILFYARSHLHEKIVQARGFK